MINHVQESWLPGGYLGVDAFFVVSGLVITKSLLELCTEDSRPRQKLVVFWLRRTYRLWPMLFVTTLLTTALLLVTGLALPGPLLTAFSGLIGMSNLRLTLGRFDYFSLDTDSDWFMHTWSLSVEEQIYFVLSAVGVFSLGSLAPNNACRRVRKFQILLLLMAIASLMSPVVFTIPELVRFYSPHARLYQVTFGALLATVEFRRKSSIFDSSVSESRFGGTQRPAHLACALGAVGLIGSFTGLIENAALASLFVTLCTLIVLLSSTAWQREVGLIPGRAITWIGDRSYSIYLVHWPVILFCEAFIAARTLQIATSIALTVLLGSGGYSFIEERTRWAWRKLSIRSSLSLIGVLFVGTLTLSFLAYVYNEHQTRPPIISAEDASCRNPNSDVWLVGDSHLNAIISEFATILEGDCTKVGDFGLVLNLRNLAQNAAGQRDVEIFLTGSEKLIEMMRESPAPPKVVIVTHFLTAYLSAPEAAPGSADFVATEWESADGNKLSRMEFISALESQLADYAVELASTGGRLIVTAPPPDFNWVRYPGAMELCANQRVVSKLCNQFRTAARLDIQLHLNRRKDTVQMLERLEERFRNFSAVGLDSPFCTPVECSNYDGATPLYLDDDHLNSKGSEKIAPLLQRALLTADG